MGRTANLKMKSTGWIGNSWIDWTYFPPEAIITAKPANPKVYRQSPAKRFLLRGFIRGLCGYFSICWAQGGVTVSNNKKTHQKMAGLSSLTWLRYPRIRGLTKHHAVNLNTFDQMTK